MWLDVLYFIVGIVMIVAGANFLTDGAASLSRRLGLSPLMVGLTIVAFGTSAPELVVSLMSALNGSSDISLGNVVGSNIFNVLAIGGVSALVAPLSITSSTIRREIPLLLLASLTLGVMAFDGVFSGLVGQLDFISRGEGLVLLSFFAIFLAYSIAISKPAPESIEPADAVEESRAEEEITKRSLWVYILLIVGGLMSLIFGGQLFVSSATNMARAMGISEAVIGLTLVAAGTSLPELATSVVAALKGQQEIAVGNIVGSGIFNIFAILGITATVTPIRVAGVGGVDFLVMIGATLLLYLFGVFFGSRTITRGEGAILLLGYIGYTTALIMMA